MDAGEIKMKTCKRRPRAKGFTLLEMVMAITILALIVSSVTVGLRLASATIGRGEETAREAARLRAAVGLIERAVRSADPRPASAGRHSALLFAGENNSLRFLTAQSIAALGTGGSRLISFHEVAGPGGGLAVSTASPFRAEVWEGTEEPRILVPGAESVSFSYSAGPAGDGNWEWSPYWYMEERGGVPLAVRVEFVVSEGETSRRTSFVVSIMTANGAGI